jgi:CDP-ribitol ribitolphosphotransferase / teichoic acid ribitol-phosphate polymerase
LKKWILKMVVGLLRIMYMPLKQFHVTNKITLISRQSDEVPADFLLIDEYFSSKRPDIKVVILTRKLKTHSMALVSYPLHMLRQMYHLSTSKLVILDGYCIVASVLNHKPNTRIVQIWHATAAIKKFGWQIVGKPSGSDINTATIMRMHANYDYIIAPSKVTGGIYQEAFRVSEDKIRYLGLPHLSLLQTVEPKNLSEIRRFYNINPDKQIILYVPTFRNGKDVNLKALIHETDFDKYALVAKVHPKDKLPPNDERVIYADRYSTTEWMQSADIIITDYSSLMIEVAILKKPLYLFVYDMEEYIGDTGLNMNFSKEAIGPMVFSDANRLMRAIEHPYPFELLSEFLSRYIEIDYSKTLWDTGTFLEQVFNGAEEDEEKN